ncbi:ComF family protein, partial [Micromonospora sp. STR1s_6]|nr:ComF family protein [Micromonospora tarensis]
VHRPLRALPRPDSVTLDSAGRAAAAEAAFQPRSTAPARVPGGGAGPLVVLLDDIVTTGVTLAAASRVLTAIGWAPSVAVVLAATEKRRQL